MKGKDKGVIWIVLKLYVITYLIWYLAIAQLVQRWIVERSIVIHWSMVQFRIVRWYFCPADKDIHHQLMISMKYSTFYWRLVMSSWVFLIFYLHIHFCLSLGLFINKYVQICIAWPWIISQSDMINMEYIFFHHTIIGSSHTIRALRIMHFKFSIRISLIDDKKKINQLGKIV